jgi:hypothetical protein
MARSSSLKAGALALALLVACGGKKQEEAAPPPPPIEGMSAIPGGATRVVGGDIAKLVASRLVRRGVAAVFERDTELEQRVERLVDSCQIVPGKNVTHFLIGLGDGADEAVMALSGSFAENTLAACVQKALGDDGRLSTKSVGGRTAYLAQSGDGSPVWFALGSSRSLIVASSEEWLDRGLGKGPRLADDAAMKAILADAPTEAAIWAAGKVPEEIGRALVEAAGGEIGPPRSMTGGLELDEALNAELRARFASAFDANKLKMLAKLQMPAIAAVAQRNGLGKLVSRLDIGSEGDIVVLRLAASAAELSDLLAAVDSDAGSLQNPASAPPTTGPEGEVDGQGKPD